MAIRIEQKKRLNAVELVSVNDDAVDLDTSDIAEYKKTGDMAHLKFLPNAQPTIFLMNFELKGKDAEVVKNSMLGGKDENGEPLLTFGSWAFRVVKYTLKDIKNPADIPEDCKLVFKKDERGYASDDVLAKMNDFGIVDELFALYTQMALSSTRSNAKK